MRHRTTFSILLTSHLLAWTLYMGTAARSRKCSHVKPLSGLHTFKPNVKPQNSLKYDPWIVRLICLLNHYNHAFHVPLSFLPARTRKPVLVLPHCSFIKSHRLMQVTRLQIQIQHRETRRKRDKYPCPCPRQDSTPRSKIWSSLHKYFKLYLPTTMLE